MAQLLEFRDSEMHFQRAIKEKKECYKHLFLDRSADNIEMYKVAKKIVK